VINEAAFSHARGSTQVAPRGPGSAGSDRGSAGSGSAGSGRVPIFRLQVLPLAGSIRTWPDD
jgi:hypothetical protein